MEKPSSWSDFDWLWVELDRAIHTCPPGETMLERHATLPWESKDPSVLEVWERIVDPKNREELEARLRKDSNPIAEKCIRKALETCLRKCAKNR
jgi:hypothetical protein